MEATLEPAPTLLGVAWRHAPKSLAYVAADYVCDLIFSGQQEPGSRLQPLPLAKELGISSTPVREALALLEHEGMLTLEPRRGYSVSRLTRTDVEDILALDAHLESILSCRALECIGEADIRQLEALDESIRHEVSIGAAERVAHLNGVFHGMLAELSPNSDLLRRFRSSTWRSRPARFYSTIPGFVAATHHGGIIDAVKAKDPVRIDAEIRSHAEISVGLIVHHLESMGFFGP
jgi:DNA-binding GntR family transcriptional regulator